MSEDQLVADAKLRQMSPWQRYRFASMIVGAIVIAVGMVAVAMALYYDSDAALLDLSRPGYLNVREQANDDEQFDGFSASGAIDKSALDEFERLYNERAQKATAIDSFGGEAMTDETLGVK